jgi:O-succinylbenzoic acid--CoA ligase
MKKMPYTSININGVFSDEKNLPDICRLKLSDKRNPEWERKFYQFIVEWISTDSFVNTRTSGSTGKPKQIRISKEKMIQSTMMTGKFFGLKPDDKALLCLPVDFIAGKMMVVRSFVIGLNLIPVEPSGNPIEKINEKFDFAAMTPMQVNNILEATVGAENLNRITKLIIGGADIHPELLNKIRLLKNETWQTYGMTETITHIAVRKLNPPGETEYYHALPEVSFKTDGRGCLIIYAPFLSNEKIVTNDIVVLKNDNEFKTIGRYDNIINTGGAKVSPEQIEIKLSPYINGRFIIAGLPDKRLGQKVTLIIEGSSPVKYLISKLAEKANLSKFEIPRNVMSLSEFPVTANGKIMRKEVINLINSNLHFES